MGDSNICTILRAEHWGSLILKHVLYDNIKHTTAEEIKTDQDFVIGILADMYKALSSVWYIGKDIIAVGSLLLPKHVCICLISFIVTIGCLQL